MGQYSCKIIDREDITRDIVWISLEAAEIARESFPGQFVHVRVSTGIDPLLRRPLSIHRVDHARGTIELLYRVVGSGTALMQSWERGRVVDLMGPLGNGFDVNKSFTHALVVAGGMGSAPIFFLVDELIASGKSVTLFWGVKEGGEIFREENFKNRGVEVRLASEDGSREYKGFVTDLMEEFLSDQKNASGLEGFVCGPKPMLKKIQTLAKRTSFDWQVSMEEKMACGVGVCLGCPVKMRQGGFRMICSDGPVFNLKEVLLDD
ncbi:MAG: dihydroorotate dehydrogenase electron transfer subunit [bacterium]